MILTAEFDIKAMTYSKTAEKYNIIEQYLPLPQDIIDNLHALHENIIIPLVEYLPGELQVSCAYRCNKLNARVGSKPTSQHPRGMAADLEYYENGIECNKKIIDAVKTLNLEFDQMIDERNLAWVHISYNKGKNRKQFFKL